MSQSLQRGQPPLPFISKPTVIGYSPIFRIILSPPPCNFLAYEPFPNCVQLHYSNLYKSLLWLYDEGYQEEVVLNEIPF